MKGPDFTTKDTKHALSKAEGITKFKSINSEPFVSFVIFVVRSYNSPREEPWLKLCTSR